MWISIYPNTIYWRDYPHLHWIFLAPLSNISWLNMWRFTSQLSILFYWPMRLFKFQYHTVLNTILCNTMVSLILIAFSFISFINVLSFLVYTYLISLVKFIFRNFIDFNISSLWHYLLHFFFRLLVYGNVFLYVDHILQLYWIHYLILRFFLGGVLGWNYIHFLEVITRTYMLLSVYNSNMYFNF